jgi:precorrin isomerase
VSSSQKIIMAAPPAAPQLNVVLNNIQQGLQTYAQNNLQQTVRDNVKEQIKRTRQCDGSIVADIREWIAEVELTIPIIGATPGAVVEVAAGTARGPLR